MKTKTLKLLSGLVCALALAVPQHSAHAASTKTITFASGTNWRVYKSDPALGSARSKGWAQTVCVNPRFPTPCPQGALNYGKEVPNAWGADLSSIPGAAWVWAPKITPSTAPADLDEYFFSKKFNVRGNIVNATVAIAGDDFVQVIVNGVVVGSNGSVENIDQAAFGQFNLLTFNIAPFLVKGKNTITIRGQNGPGYYTGLGCAPCNYNQNPAGVVFGGQITLAKGASASIEIDDAEDDTE